MGCLGAHFFQLQQDPVPGQVIPGIDLDSQEREDIFNMCRLGQFQPTPLLKVLVAAGQFHLQLVRVKSGAEQDGDFGSLNTLILEFLNFVNYKPGLGSFVACSKDNRFAAAFSIRE